MKTINNTYSFQMCEFLLSENHFNKYKQLRKINYGINLAHTILNMW